MGDDIRQLEVIDSHTGGEPTRILVAGGPDLGSGTVAERLRRLRSEHDWVRTTLLCEPRGFDAMVGALVCEPSDPTCIAGAMFFNNVGYLGMCGHGTMGLAVTLAFLGRIGPGKHRIETPVGVVTADLHGTSRVGVTNVPSRRFRKGVQVEVEAGTERVRVRGDVAWGGNWFFLVEDHREELSLTNLERLTDLARRIRGALRRDGVLGEGGAEIDHVELSGPPSHPDADCRSFVLCPGLAYDRSPCGTGTSAKVACLAEDGRLAEGEVWRQESIVGSVFEATYVRGDRGVVPTLVGEAFVTARSTLIVDPRDPFEHGIRSA